MFGNVSYTSLYHVLIFRRGALLTSTCLLSTLIRTYSDAGNQPPAPHPSRLGGVLSAARLVVCTRPKPFVMGLPCVFVIGLLASAIRPRLPVIGADVRQIRDWYLHRREALFPACPVLCSSCRPDVHRTADRTSLCGNAF